MAEIKKISTELQLLDKFLDTSGDAGTSGQVLTSTGTGINWVSGGSLPGGPYLPLSAGSSYPLTGILYAGQGVKFTGGTIASATTVLHTNNVIYSRGGSGGMFLQNADGSDGMFIANDHVRFETSSTERMRITNAGNVGINTTNPIDKLNVHGGTGNATAQQPKIAVTRTSSTGNVLVGKMILTTKPSDTTNHGNLVFQVKTTASSGESSAYYTNAITIDGKNANVGIGTSSPSEKLEVDGIIKAVHTDDSYATYRGNGVFFNRNDSYLAPLTNNTSTLNIGYNGGKWGNVEINAAFVKFENGANEFMRIASSGNVGIGATNPTSKLHIVAADGEMVDTYMVNIINQEATAGDNFGLKVNAGTNSSDVSMQINNSSGSALMRVRGDGNVGIGTTSPYSKLNVIPSSNPTTPTTANQIAIGESTANSWYNLRLGYFLEGGAYKGSIQSISGNVPGALVLNGDGGNVGIGTTSPARLLSVNGIQGWSASGTEKAAINPTSTGTDFTLIGNNGNIRFDSRPSGNSYVGTGNFGIGTTTPDSKLNINGNSGDPSATYTTTAANSTISIGNFSASGLRMLFGVNPSTPSTWIQNQYTTNQVTAKLLLNPLGGNVGIGTTNPQTKLHVNSSNTVSYIHLTNSTTGSTGNDGVDFGVNGSDVYLWNRENSSTIFGTNGTERMRIGNTGNVGIGTTSPSANLDIEDASGVIVDINSSSGDGQFRFQDNGTTKWSVGRDNTQQNFVFSNSSSLGSDNVLTLAHSSGNVGIGTTSPLGKLQVNEYTVASQGANIAHGEASIFADSGDEGLYIGVKNAAYPNRGYGFKVTTSGVNSDFAITEHGLSGDRFIIKSGGNVGIGTTSPGTALQVGGLDDGSNYDITVGWNAVSSQAVGTKRSALTFKTNQTGVNNEDIYKWDIAMVTAPATASNEPFGSNLAFLRSTRSSTSVDETTMILTQSGNVGIGTTSPSEKLDVNGTVNLTNIKIATAQGTDGQVLTSTGSGIAWEDVSGGSGVTSIAASTVDGKEGIEVTNGSSAAVTVGLDLDLIDENVSGMTHVVGVDGDDKNIKTVKSQFFAYNEQYIGYITGNGTATSFTVTHDLGAYYLIQIVDAKSTSDTYLQEVYPKIVRTSATAVTISFNTAPANGHPYQVYMTKINPRQI